MSIELKSLGVDPLFPGGREAYISSNGFYLNEFNGGPKSVEWIDNNFEAEEDDIYVVSFPKTGTTWMQELVYVIANDLDFEKAKSGTLDDRFPYLEMLPDIQRGAINKLLHPRFIKSHYPYSLLPKSILAKNCKIVYPIRNPKDTLVSYYYFAKMKNVLQYQGDFETFFDLFIKEERLNYSPFSKHILEFWEQRDRNNILIVHYEDLQKDYFKEIQRIAQFLGKTLTDDQTQQVAEHCCFENMKSNECTNRNQIFKQEGFMRKGQVGDWKKHFTEEMNKKMDAYIEQHFKNSSLEFKYFI